MRLTAVRSAGLLFGIAVLSACAGSTQRSAVDSSLGPAMTIERFLRATNQNDLDTMAALFGTRDGSVNRVWSKMEIDERMMLFANVLRHSDYTIVSEELVAGRRDEATQLNVQMVITGDTLEVPFTMVRSTDQNWLIERIGIDVVTRGRGTGSGGR